MHQYDYDNIKARFEQLEHRIKTLETFIAKSAAKGKVLCTNKTGCPCMKCTPYTLSGVSL